MSGEGPEGGLKFGTGLAVMGWSWTRNAGNLPGSIPPSILADLRVTAQQSVEGRNVGLNVTW